MRLTACREEVAGRKRTVRCIVYEDTKSSVWAIIERAAVHCVRRIDSIQFEIGSGGVEDKKLYEDRTMENSDEENITQFAERVERVFGVDGAEISNG